MESLLHLSQWSLTPSYFFMLLSYSGNPNMKNITGPGIGTPGIHIILLLLKFIKIRTTVQFLIGRGQIGGRLGKSKSCTASCVFASPLLLARILDEVLQVFAFFPSFINIIQESLRSIGNTFSIVHSYTAKPFPLSSFAPRPSGDPYRPHKLYTLAFCSGELVLKGSKIGRKTFDA
ncbi:BA75_02149T0 [Komagataella pastoris]|uniref:BA75_02149T0 n=1 Tax=Komagataella pastoris TaxID=4922 RepID=A0A1B2JDK0_PICPA|nr:BA75_02149T0 [Komagataella pastoris]